mgnify:CR=1 FL=1
MIKCIETNKTYPSAAQAAKELGITKAAISMCVNGKRKKANGYTFIKINNNKVNTDIVNNKVNTDIVNNEKVNNNKVNNEKDNTDIVNNQEVNNNKVNDEVNTHSNSDSNNDSEQFNDTTFYKNLFYQCINDFNKYRYNKIYPLIDKAKLLQEENTKLKEQRNKVIESVADDTTINELKEIIESQNKEITKLNNEYDLLMDSQGNGDFLKKKYRQQRDENKKMVQELISMKYIVEKAKDEVQEAIWGDFTQLEHEDLQKENLEMKKRLSKYEDVTEFKTLNYLNLPKEDNVNIAPRAETADIDTIDKCLDDICNDKENESNLIKDVRDSENRTFDVPNKDNEIRRTFGLSNKDIDSRTFDRPNNKEEVQEMAWSDI